MKQYSQNPKNKSEEFQLSHSPTKNRKMAETIITKFDPSFRQRWELYDGIIKRLSGPNAAWLDAGCGRNEAIEEFPCGLNIGIDTILHPEVFHNPPFYFVQSNLEKIPFRDSTFTLVTLNMVVEHIYNPGNVFSEIYRILKPGGYMLIHTTNIHSPLILFAKCIPETLRKQLFTGVLGAREADVFKTYHKVNSLSAFRKIDDFEIIEIHFVQNLHWSFRSVFLLLFAYHMLTRLPGLWRLRTNIVVLLKKKHRD
jgi:SAM-dependent methyltransferase